MKLLSIILFSVSLFACADSLGTQPKSPEGGRCYSNLHCQSNYCAFNDQTAPGYCVDHSR